MLHRAWHYPLTQVARVLVLGVLGGWFALFLWGGESVTLDVATIHGRISPARVGSTTIDLPPFGSISARTHAMPLSFTMRLDALRVERLLEQVTNESSREMLLVRLQVELKRFVTSLLLKALGIAAVGGLLLCLLFGVRRFALLGGALIGLLGVAVPLGLSLQAYQPRAFENPSYHGELARAPQLLRTAQEIWRNYSSWSDRLPVVVNRVVDFYRQMDRISPMSTEAEQNMLRVLQISDLHNNPYGVKLAQALANEYKVGLVLVTGDITDIGHELEADLLQQWNGFTMPMAVISGNHDSRAIMTRMAEFPRVTVLDNGKVATLAGLRIMGFGDPAAERDGPGEVNPTPAQLRELTARIRARVAGGVQADILMVHNFRVAEQVIGLAPVVVTGHSHNALIRNKDGHILVNPGSTGAAGLRYFSSKAPLSYGAVVLYFRPEDKRLMLIDLISLDEPAGNYTITRRNLATTDVDAPIGTAPPEE